VARLVFPESDSRWRNHEKPLGVRANPAAGETVNPPLRPRTSSPISSAAFPKKFGRVCVCENVRLDILSFQLPENRMFGDHVAQRLVRKTLFVSAQNARRIYAGENRRLSGRALRATFDAEPRVGRRENAIENNMRRLVYKMGERFDILNAGEWVIARTLADAQTVYKEKQN
jgi:hypothetical protein